MDRDTLIKTIFESMGALKRGMGTHMHSIMQGSPISRSQFELLATVYHMQPVNFKQLSQQLYLTPGSISQLVEALENQQLLQRQTNANDRRVQTLQLTPQGEELLASIHQKGHKILEDVMRELTTEELESWLHIQQKIAAGVQAECATNAQTKEK